MRYLDHRPVRSGQDHCGPGHSPIVASQWGASSLLDGDAVREVIQDPHIGHDRASHLDNARRICRLAKLLADQGQVVLVVTMSLFSEIHRWNREHLPHYRDLSLKGRHFQPALM